MDARSQPKRNAKSERFLKLLLKGAAACVVLTFSGLVEAQTRDSMLGAPSAPSSMSQALDTKPEPSTTPDGPAGSQSVSESLVFDALASDPQDSPLRDAVTDGQTAVESAQPLALSAELQALHAPTTVFVGVSRTAMDAPAAQMIAQGLSQTIGARGWARVVGAPQEANVVIEVLTRFDPNDQWRTYALQLDTLLNGVPLPAASGFQVQLDRRPGLFCSSAQCRAEFVAERLVPAVEQSATLDRIAEIVTAQRAALLAEAVDRAAQAAQAAQEAAEREAERIAAAQEELTAREAALIQETEISEPSSASQPALSSFLSTVIFAGLAAWIGLALLKARRSRGKKSAASPPAATIAASPPRTVRAAATPSGDTPPTAPANHPDQAMRPRYRTLQFGGALVVGVLGLLWSAPPVRENFCSLPLGQPGLANACCSMEFTEKEVVHAVAFTPVGAPVQLEGYFSHGAIGFSSEQAARDDARARLQGEAQVLCARRDPEFERLLEVDARPAEYRCTNGPAGWSCALKYEANCQIERREQIERCPGAPTDAPAAPGAPT
jgi:hypothetical protein